MKTLLAWMILLLAVPAFSQTANLWIDGGSGNCTRSSSPDAYSSGTACASFNAALTAAGSADTIIMVPGTLAAQSVNVTKTSPGPTLKCELTQAQSSNACIIGALTSQGAWYTIQDITMDIGNTDHSSTWFNQASNVTFINFKVHGAFVGIFWEDPSGGNMTGVTWNGGELIDPNTTSGTRTCNGNGGTADNQGMWIGTFNSHLITNSVIENVTFNPLFVNSSVICNGSDLHLERLRIDGNIQNLTVKKNIFASGGNENTGTIFMSTFLGTSYSNWVFQNNYIGGGGTAAIQNNGHCQMTAEYNTWGNDLVFTSCSGSDQTFIGNAMAWPSFQGCSGTRTKNVLQSSQSWSCGSDKVVIGPDFSTSALGFAANGYTPLSGSPVISAGETTCATTANGEDLFGNPRPVGAACDAGAVEFGSSSAVPPSAPQNLTAIVH